MKKTIVVIALLAAIGTPSFARTDSHTLDFGSYGFALNTPYGVVSDGILGVAYRGISYPQHVRFYVGSDVSLGIPLIIYTFDPYYGFMSMPSTDDLFMSVKIPLGYRWPGEGKKMGFYLGRGPALQMIADFDAGAVYGVGVFGELGWETNKTSKVGFHFAFQLGWSPLTFVPGSGTLNGVAVSEAAIRFGMTWPRIQGSGTGSSE